MESFAGLLQILGISWASGCFVAVEARIFSNLTPNVNVDAQCQGITPSTLEEYQMSFLGILDQKFRPWNVVCLGLESDGDKCRWKSCQFFLSFCSRGEIVEDMGIVAIFPNLIIAIVQHRRFIIVMGGRLTKSFAGFLCVVVFWWLDDYSSWGVGEDRVEFMGYPMLLLRGNNL